MPRLAALGRIAAPAGRQESSVVEVPPDATQCILRLPRNAWPVRHAEGKAGEVVEGHVELSFDGGRTWPMVYSVGSHGGNYFNRRGDLMVETTLRCVLPEVGNARRRVRVVLDRFALVDTRADLDFE